MDDLTAKLQTFVSRRKTLTELRKRKQDAATQRATLLTEINTIEGQIEEARVQAALAKDELRDALNNAV